jgi:hypothetical protein
MNKKGVTLVELLGAIIILGLLVAMVATFIGLINNASRIIALNAKANSEGLLITKTLEDQMKDFGSTDYSLCVNPDCIILEKHYSNVYDPITDDIVLTIYNPALSKRIELLNNQLLINSVPYVIDGMTLHSSSSLSVTESGTSVSIIITIVLEATEGQLFTFTASHLFNTSSIPS